MRCSTWWSKTTWPLSFFAETQGREAAQFTTEVLDSNVVVAGISDGGAHVKFLTAGIYPTDMLIWLVRDQKTVSLEDAHYKLSYLPAHLGGFKDRGAIREHAPADIVVYDLGEARNLALGSGRRPARGRVAAHPEV